MLTPADLLQYLQTNRLPYRYFEHPAVFTCEEAEHHYPEVEASSTKNLLLCDKKGKRFFLAVTSCQKSVHLGQLAQTMGVNHLRFASEANLMRLLGVSPGAVTLLGLVNDPQTEVELWLDAEVWQSDQFFCHPLVNTATLALSRATLEAFFALTGHSVHFFNAAL